MCARSPPVPTTSTASARTSSGSSTRVALASIASTRPAISAGVSPLARSAIAKPGDLDRGGVAGHDLAHRPGGVRRVELVAASAGRSAGSARCVRPWRGLRRGTGDRRGVERLSRACPWCPAGPRRRGGPRSMPAMVWPVVTGSSGYTSVASTWANAASQRSAARAMTTQVGGGSAYSSLVCRAMPRPPAGAASPSRIIRSISYVVEQPAALLPGRRVDELDRQVGGGPGADGQPDPVADREVVAVQQDGVRRRRRS